MISVELTTRYDLIHQILSDKELYKASEGKELNIKEFEVDKSFKYLLIRSDEELMGCFRIRQFTKILLECHIHILPKFWGTKSVLKASLKGFKWVKNNTGFLKLITDVPIVCEHVIRLCKKLEWAPCGIIRKGVVYNKQFSDLLLFEYDLNKGE